MIKNMICVVCPKGCHLEADFDGKELRSVTGNACPRGEAYALDECTHPMRTLTTTVKVSEGKLVPVKSQSALPKDRMFACMKEINSVILQLPVRIGDIIVKNIQKTGINIVATKSIE